MVRISCTTVTNGTVVIAATLGLANKARPQLAISGAPKTPLVFSNYAGELSHGSVSIRVPYAAPFRTYFRSGADAPQLANAVSLLRQPAKMGCHQLPGLVTPSGAINGITTDPIWSKRPSPVPLFGLSRYVEQASLWKTYPPSTLL